MPGGIILEHKRETSDYRAMYMGLCDGILLCGIQLTHTDTTCGSLC